MFVGSEVWYHTYTKKGRAIRTRARIIGRFYEPGDPVPGLNLAVRNGIIGGVDEGDCCPYINPRAEKRRDIKMTGGHAASAAYEAYQIGANEGYHARWKRSRGNPYPPGRRHDEWNRGYRHGYNDRPARRYEN